MKSLENIGVLEKDEEKGGRRISQAGQRDLDREFLPLLFLRSLWGFRVKGREREYDGACVEKLFDRQ